MTPRQKGRLVGPRRNRWLVAARLIPAGAFDFPDKIGFAGCQVAGNELRATVGAFNDMRAKQQAGRMFEAAVWALSLASHRPVSFEIRSCKDLGESSRRIAYDYGSIALPHKLSAEEIGEALNLYRMMRRLRRAPRRLNMALADLQLAGADGTAFAFVHLHRGLEQVREYFGGSQPKSAWRNMRSALGVSKSYLDFVSSRRNEPEFGTAHAPPKRGRKSQITHNEVQEGMRRTSEVLARFIRYLAHEPVGQGL